MICVECGRDAPRGGLFGSEFVCEACLCADDDDYDADELGLDPERNFDA